MRHVLACLGLYNGPAFRDTTTIASPASPSSPLIPRISSFNSIRENKDKHAIICRTTYRPTTTTTASWPSCSSSERHNSTQAAGRRSERWPQENGEKVNKIYAINFCYWEHHGGRSSRSSSLRAAFRGVRAAGPARGMLPSETERLLPFIRFSFKPEDGRMEKNKNKKNGQQTSETSWQQQQQQREELARSEIKHNPRIYRL